MGDVLQTEKKILTNGSIISNFCFFCDIAHCKEVGLKNYSVCSCCAGDKIEKNEMGWTCGAYG